MPRGTLEIGVYEPPAAPVPAQASRSNNLSAGRNILGGAIAGAGVFGTIYTGVAFLNMEDGAGEIMLGPRIATLARNSTPTLATSQMLEGVASASGTVEAAYAAANGAGTGFALGAGGGLALTSPMCN